LKKRLADLRKKERRLIVGIETGTAPGNLGAALVEVSGSGDDTMLYLRGFTSRSLSPELMATIEALSRDEKFDSEELAGISFLVLNQLSKLYDEVLESASAKPEEVDCIGLSSLEIGEHAFPSDPSVFSEMTNCVVASRFRIGVENGAGGFVAVDEALLQGIVSEMIDRFGLDEEVQDAVAVALLANESIFHEDSSECENMAGEKGKQRKSLRAIKRTGAASAAAGSSCLYGEFFFPA
jgi:hypothetical protein